MQRHYATQSDSVQCFHLNHTDRQVGHLASLLDELRGYAADICGLRVRDGKLFCAPRGAPNSNMTAKGMAPLEALLNRQSLRRDSHHLQLESTPNPAPRESRFFFWSNTGHRGAVRGGSLVATTSMPSAARLSL